MRTLARLFLLSAATLSLSACFDDTQSIQQGSLCTYNTDPQAQRCKPGEMAWFRPERSQLISEEMALSVAAAYCDFNHQVVYNRAGVLCVFTDQRLHIVK